MAIPAADVGQYAEWVEVASAAARAVEYAQWIEVAADAPRAQAAAVWIEVAWAPPVSEIQGGILQSDIVHRAAYRQRSQIALQGAILNPAKVGRAR